MLKGEKASIDPIYKRVTEVVKKKLENLQLLKMEKDDGCTF